MKLLTRQTEYAVTALLELALAEKGCYLSCAELSRRRAIPAAFLRAVMWKLAAAGIVESKEGKTGGVRLAVCADTLSLRDVALACQGRADDCCLFSKKLCACSPVCILKKHVSEIRAVLLEKLAAVKIGSLARELKTKGGK